MPVVKERLRKEGHPSALTVAQQLRPLLPRNLALTRNMERKTIRSCSRIAPVSRWLLMIQQG
ncbi:hypothetical protein F3I62_15385 [Pseudomonas sp. R-28-1W-6]|uniref:hypothetical protein n=1 Tax=Pseudomonas sp. R-28-1W-6 TaxID=2650101 RepID=UPI0013943B2E|nr:hypothetical protein [Pseudomonas sp. R-28-1W-6]MWV13486.1 hypothetical protein [Pseudomonas sp. R-28-1W-6]